MDQIKALFFPNFRGQGIRTNPKAPLHRTCQHFVLQAVAPCYEEHSQQPTLRRQAQVHLGGYAQRGQTAPRGKYSLKCLPSAKIQKLSPINTFYLWPSETFPRFASSTQWVGFCFLIKKQQVVSFPCPSSPCPEQTTGVCRSSGCHGNKSVAAYRAEQSLRTAGNAEGQPRSALGAALIGHGLHLGAQPGAHGHLSGPRTREVASCLGTLVTTEWY